MPGANLTFSTGSLFVYSLDRVFALAANCGFDGVEVVCDRSYDSRQPENLRRLMDTYHIPVTSLHAPLPGWEIPGWPVDEVLMIQQTVSLAEQIGAEHVVIHLPRRMVFFSIGIGYKRWFIPWRTVTTAAKRWMDDGGLARLQDQTPVKICVENLPANSPAIKDRWLTWWNTLVDWPKVHEHLTLDTTHWATHNIDPITAYQAGRAQIRHIHLSNFRKGQQHLPPQTGELDISGFLTHLSQHHFDGHIVIELNPETLQAWNEDQTKQLLAEAVQFCRTALE